MSGWIGDLRLRRWVFRCVAHGGFLCLFPLFHAQEPSTISIHWDKPVLVSKTTPTLQVVVNPPLRPGQPLGGAAYRALKDLGADYVRYVPWLPYPKLAVAELDAPTKDKTSWDFSLIDPMMKDFLEATEGHPAVIIFSTMPAWLFKTGAAVTYPTDPDQVEWNYTQGTELRDPTGKDLGDYYSRLVSWYVNGGFTDENGAAHTSGYHYKLPIWEVLNEPEYEHATTPEQYTARYDAIVAGIRRASPDMKFMGMVLATPREVPGYFEYFLNRANHAPSIPLDYISYHFYATPVAGQDVESWQYTFFDQATGFVNSVRYIEQIRKRLSPDTKTSVNEAGSILPIDNSPQDNIPPPARYWNLSGALFAHLFIELSKLQIDIVGESQLVGYPTQFPSVSMMNWQTNQPNARFWVLKLLKDAFHPGDTLADTSVGSPDSANISAQAFITPAGHALLLVNRRNRALDMVLPDADKASVLTVDEMSGESPARTVKPAGGRLRLEPFAVTVVKW